MRKLTGIILGILLTGCATSSTNMGPVVRDWDSGEKRQFVQASLIETNAFAPSTSTRVLYECKNIPEASEMTIAPAENLWPEEEAYIPQITDQDRIAKGFCRVSKDGVHDAGVGAAASVLPAVIGGLSTIGAAAVLADGIRGGADNQTTNNNNNSVSEGSYADADSDANAAGDDLELGGSSEEQCYSYGCND